MVEVTSEDWNAAQIYADLYSETDCYMPTHHERIGQAFARHRRQARAEVVGEIVAWLDEMYENCESIDGMLTRMDSKDELAKMMQAKFGGRDGNE